MKKLNASTIIETLVALIIIMIILTISVMIISNIQRGSIKMKSEAFYLIKTEFDKTKQERLFYSEEKKGGNLTVKRYIENSNFGENFKVLQIQILNDKSQIIIEKREIISIE